MQPKIENRSDLGLVAFGLLLRLLKVDTSLAELRDAVGDARVGIPDMLKCAKTLGLKGTAFTTNWLELAATPLPVIVTLNSGGFLLLGKHDQDKVVVLPPGTGRPAIMTRANFEAHWDGGVLLIARQNAMAKILGWLKVTTPLHDLPIRLMQRCTGRDPKPRAKTTRQTVKGAGIAIIDLMQRAGEIRRTLAISGEESRQRATELAFLPAALEIVETPPSPIGRAISLSIVATFIAALIWACLGTIDIVAVAPGKIVPSGRTKVIQPFETGMVRAIRVQDGQGVKAGDILVELDPTMNAATLDQSRRDLIAARLTAARLRAALTGHSDPLTTFAAPDDAPPKLVQMHRKFLISQTTEQTAKLAAIDGQVAHRRAERATIQASIEKLKATLEPLGQRVETRKQLFDRQLGSRLTYLSELQEFVGHQQEIRVQQSRSSEADAAIGALEETRARTAAEYERTLFDELEKVEQKIATFEQDVVRAEKRTKMQTLTAPVDGNVQQLAVHTIGGVVTSAQSLMLIVPADSQLEIEAMVSNRDIGFVGPGQEVAIKVDTFNFTRYGLLHGTVVSVSQDAITRNKPHDRVNDNALGAEASSSEPKGQELIYSARISLDRNQMDIEDRRIKLAAGMAVSVEIKTGARRIISYLFSPLLRYKHDSLRER